MSWKKFLFSKLGLIVLLGLFTSSAYLLAGEVIKRYKIEKEINLLSQQILEIEKNNSDLSNVIDYFRSTSFGERELRRKLSLQKPGEHVVVLDPSNPQTLGVESISSAVNEENLEANWKQWWDYFFKLK